MATVRSKEKALFSDAFSQNGLLAELDDPILNRIAANIRKTRKSMRESRPLFEKLEQIAKGKASISDAQVSATELSGSDETGDSA